MNTILLYKRIAGIMLIAVLAFSILAGNRAMVYAQTGTLQPGTASGEAQTYDDLVNQRIDEIANPSYDDIVSERITQTQAERNQSVNGASQSNENPKQDGGSGNQDTVFSWKMLNPYNWIPVGMKIIGNTILMLFGWVLGLVGLIFNFIIDKTIVNLKTTIDSLGVITDIWKVIRDFINLFFIFALLYAAVGTILGLEKVDWKRTVGNLVLAALLINFSLFITKAALDLSNIVTIGFYSQLPGVGVGDINPGSIATGTSGAGGISNSIMQSLKLETIYKPQYTGGGVGGVLGDAANAPVNTFAYILSTVMGSIFICVTIVVMVAACWLFLKRFIDIIFLMIRSPIAFAGYVLPQLDEYQKNWWKELQANVTFPPVYMAMMWITFKILQSPGFQTVAPGVDGFSGLFSTLSGTTINIVFRFIVVIAMMVYALKSAGKVGVEGGEIFNDFMKKKRDQMAGAVSGAIGRNTVGRAAAAMQDKNSAAGQALRKLETVPIIGAATSKAITGGLKNVSSATFGGAKGGFDQMVKDEAKYAKEAYARVGEKVEFRERAPIKPVEPVREATDTDKTWVAKMYEFSKKNDAYEEAMVGYTARKELFEAGQGKRDEEAKKRQEQFVANYESVKASKIPFLRHLTNQEDGTSEMPLLGENRAALEAIDKDKKEKKKDDDKKAKARKDLERIRAEQLAAEEEMLAAYKEYAEAAAPTAPVREAGESDAAFANRTSEHRTRTLEHETTTNRLLSLLKEKFDDIADEGERKKKVEENKSQVKAALNKIKATAEAKANGELVRMAKQQAEIEGIRIQLAGLDEERRTAKKPTTEANFARLQGELAAATVGLKVLEQGPNKRAEQLKTAEARKTEAANKREQVINRENQILQEEKLESLGKDLGEVKDKTGKKDEGGGGEKK